MIALTSMENEYSNIAIMDAMIAWYDIKNCYGPGYGILGAPISNRLMGIKNCVYDEVLEKMIRELNVPVQKIYKS
jgi:hypothetical protein